MSNSNSNHDVQMRQEGASFSSKLSPYHAMCLLTWIRDASPDPEISLDREFVQSLHWALRSGSAGLPEFSSTEDLLEFVGGAAEELWPGLVA